MHLLVKAKGDTILNFNTISLLFQHVIGHSFFVQALQQYALPIFITILLQCIEPWIEQSSNCPIDRTEIVLSSLHHDFILENIIGDYTVSIFGFYKCSYCLIEFFIHFIFCSALSVKTYVKKFRLILNNVGRV